MLNVTQNVVTEHDLKLTG